MVRKWSYLKTSNLAISVHTLKSLTQLLHFKVFRKTTRFKKFNRGITRVVRKTYARRKHRTNCLIWYYITKSWVANYLKMRQFERFYSGLGRFQFEAFSSNFEVFSVKLHSISNYNGVNIISCAKNVLGKHTNQSTSALFLKNPTKYANTTSIQLINLQDISASSEIYPNLVNFENSLFPYGDMETYPFTHLHTQILDHLTNSTCDHVLQINKSVYSILVKLSVFNVCNVHRL